ncbi:MAG: hypothetical protein KF766_00575 [Rhodocyclaceae bacterium]|nr:hypothetical protein [Rhodocyclaceae bacterium]MCP5296057.1 hypothetical protein [Zoogloeaceae bacterium]
MMLAAFVLSILALVGAIGAFVKVLWHTHGMIRGVRASANWWVNLIPFLAFSLPGALDASGQEHRFKMIVWLCIAAALMLVSVGLQFAVGD